MNPNLNLYTKTKEILNVSEINQKFKNLNEINYRSLSDNKSLYNNNNNNYYYLNNYSYDNKSILNKNNEKLFNLNKNIKDDKKIISNILSPMKYDFEKEKKEYTINTTLNHLKNIQSMYNLNTIKLQNEIINTNNKKKKLLLVYNSLFHFKQKLLNKEKHIKEKEYKINKFENNLKINENILKNNLEAFNNYINYQTHNLINKFKNIKNYHQQKEDELKLREQKINEYEMVIKNIIKRKEEENKEKLIKCGNIGEQIEKKLEIEMERILQKEKENQIKKDIELIEKEKEKIIKEKELIEKEKEKIQLEKEKNKNNEIRNIKISKILNQKEIDFHKIQSLDNTINSQYQTPIRENENINLNNKFEKLYNNKYSERKSLTPMIFHSFKYKISNPYNKNKNKYSNRDDSLFSYNIVSGNNYTSRQIINEKKYPVRKINSYIHDNIYLLKNKYNNKSNRSEKLKYSKTLTERNNYEYFNNNNNYSNRTINLVGNSSNKKIIDDNTNSDILNLKNKSQSLFDKNKSKYLETSTNDNNETYCDINKKIFEVEKVLQLVKIQDKKIQMIKDKLDKKIKNSS